MIFIKQISEVILIHKNSFNVYLFSPMDGLITGSDVNRQMSTSGTSKAQKWAAR